MLKLISGVYAMEPRSVQAYQDWLRAAVQYGLREAGTWRHPAPPGTGQASPRKASPADGPADDAEDDGLPIQRVGPVAVISVAGVMVKRASSYWSEVLAGTEAVRRALEAAAADPQVKAVLLRIDSPGGTVDGLAELGETIAAVAARMPVIAQSDGMIASAAYYAAVHATAIYAQRMDEVGSIGTRWAIYDFSKMFEEAGIKAIPIDSAPADRPHKSAGLMGTAITDTQIAHWQHIVDVYFADFRAAVMRGRKLTAAQFDAVADGRMFVAAEAAELGLIDGVQSLDATLAGLLDQVGKSDTARARLAQRVRG